MSSNDWEDISGWKNSGETFLPTNPGQYQIEFKTITGLRKPSNISVDYKQDDKLLFTGTYSTTQGTLETLLQIFIEPETVVIDGVKWKVVGMDTWNKSGDKIKVTEGLAKVEVSIPTGWSGEEVYEFNVYHNILNVYTIKLIAFTRLKVLIYPQDAVLDGMRWRLIPTTKWRQSGEELDVGNHYGFFDIEFLNVKNWNKRSRIRRKVSQDKLNVLHAAFERVSVRSHVTINLLPEEISKNVFWRRVGTSKWYKSGEVDEYVLSGNRIIEFSDYGGFVKPDNQEIFVDELENLEYTFHYSEPKEVAVTIDLKPENMIERINKYYDDQCPYLTEDKEKSSSIKVNLDIDKGRWKIQRYIDYPKWRFFGTDEWLDFGKTVITNIGSRSIEFINIPGWKCPRYVHCLVDISEYYNESSTENGISNIKVNLDIEEGRWKIVFMGDVKFSNENFYEYMYSFIKYPSKNCNDAHLEGEYSKNIIEVPENQDLAYLIRWISRNEYGYSETTSEYIYTMLTNPSDVINHWI